MAQICFRNKYGHCKYGGTCRLKHIDFICELETCQISSCQKRHPKECYWFRDYQWCKFRPCSYKHTLIQNSMKNTTQKELDDLENMIKDRDQHIEGLSNKVQELEFKYDELEKIVNNLNFKCSYCQYIGQTEKKLRQHKLKNHNENDLNETIEEEPDDKIDNLEKFVLKLQNKVENLESASTGWKEDETLEELIRRNSHEVKCDECDYRAQNQARIDRHIKRDHSRKCDICKGDYTYTGKARFERHMELVHKNSEVPLSESEMETMNYSESEDIRYGPETPRCKALTKYKLRPKKLN